MSTFGDGMSDETRAAEAARFEAERQAKFDNIIANAGKGGFGAPITTCARCSQPKGPRGVWCEGCEAERDREDERRRAEQRAESRLRWLVGLSDRLFPKRYRWCRFDAPELHQRVRNAKAIAAVQKAVEDGDPLVTLVGPAGAGKTVLACCAAIAAVERSNRYPMDVLFVDAMTIARARMDHRLGHEEPGVLVKTRDHDLVVIDDVGQEQASDFIAATIRELVFERHQEERQTFITTGFSPEQISTRYGEGFARRLFEGCKITVGGGK